MAAQMLFNDPQPFEYMSELYIWVLWKPADNQSHA